MNDILTQAGSAGLFANVLVSLLRLAFPSLISWRPPVLAVLFGILAAFLLRVAAGDLMSWQLAAQAVLAGFLAGAGAITSATLHTKVDQDRYGALASMIRDAQPAAARKDGEV